MKRLSMIMTASLLAVLVAGRGEVLAQARAEKNGNDAIRTNGPKVLGAFRPVVANPNQSVVGIMSDGKKVAIGTIVTPEGHVLTKFSEAKGNIVCMFRDGTTREAKVVGVHEPYDLVMLKMEGSNYQPIRWADPKAVEVGNWVATPGLGTEPVAVGVISVGARKVSTRDLPPARNDSGFLGVALETAEGAVRITSVEPKSPAEKAGIKTGDLVTTIAGKVIQTSESMIENVQRYKAGDEVILKIKRGMEELDFKCVLARRPLDRAAEQNSMGNENSLRRGGFPTILQHDTVLKPVDCGGPLVDLDGQAVGINIARAGRTETYAVPASDVLALLPQLKSGTLLPESLKKETLASSNVQSLRSELEKAESDLKGLIQKIQENRIQDNNELKSALNKVKKLRDELDKVEIETIKVKK